MDRVPAYDRRPVPSSGSLDRGGRVGPRWDRHRARSRRRPSGNDTRVVRVDGPRAAWSGEPGGPALIFKAVRDGRPYPDHGFSTRDWAMIPPRQIRLDTLTTTKRELALDALLADDSTFYGDLFPHAVQWHGEMYLEDGVHRALRAALQQRNVIHVRVLDLDALMLADQDVAADVR
ncbi:type II toxin-antitoxin system VapB family antitoxin [Modestobacter excelsi]|uniref:type II toxin-antitoxin system VapB family antitoxin n=1 Tax=Modestobacter excelsi TaxID=2213161 RepID=UPI003F6E07FB